MNAATNTPGDRDRVLGGRADNGDGIGVGGPTRLELVPLRDPRRAVARPLGCTTSAPWEVVAWPVPGGRHHLHTLGVTGSGKTTWLCHYTIGEARAGRGVAQFDCQGDLAAATLARLPWACRRRLVIIDAAESGAPPAWNPLAVPAGVSGELVAENVVGVFRQLYTAYWGPRMDDTMRAACLTLVRRPRSTLADIVTLLSVPGFRARVLGEYGIPAGLGEFWDSWASMGPTQRHQACGPVISRLRAVFTRRFARDLLAAPTSTFLLDDILDGGVLIVRLPKGVLGQDCARLVGSLLLAGLWQAATARAARPPHARSDATIVVDEAHNFLHLPIGMDDVLAESRGYRVSWMLAHQHLAQLPAPVRDAVEANARNKFYFTLAPRDATRLARHVGPFFDEHDLSGRPAFHITARVVHAGQDQTPFTLAAPPATPPIPGRAAALRAAARAHTGLARNIRDRADTRTSLASRPGAAHLLNPDPGADPGPDAEPDGEESAGRAGGRSPRRSHRRSPRQSPRRLEPPGERRGLPAVNPLLTDPGEAPWRHRD